jgi:hypothetical protein
MASAQVPIASKDAASNIRETVIVGSPLPLHGAASAAEKLSRTDRTEWTLQWIEATKLQKAGKPGVLVKIDQRGAPA